MSRIHCQLPIQLILKPCTHYHCVEIITTDIKEMQQKEIGTQDCKTAKLWLLIKYSEMMSINILSVCFLLKWHQSSKQNKLARCADQLLARSLEFYAHSLSYTSSVLARYARRYHFFS